MISPLKRINNVPEDMLDTRVSYESKVPREGTCGPTIVAYLTGKTVKETIENWIIPYRGYCSLRELERVLNKEGLETKIIKRVEKRQFILPDGISRAIARIQWGKKYSNWTIPEKNTHFVLLDQNSNSFQLFDNEAGLFEINSNRSRRYMEEGKITHFLIV